MTDVEARVRRAIEGLDYDFNRFSVPDFIEHLQAVRQREIVLNGASFDPGLHGFWIRADTADYVFFNDSTHHVHQVHHILHELGHIILGHRPRDLAAMLSPGLAAQLREALTVPLCGHCRRWEPVDTDQEREAELFVQTLQRQVLLAGRLTALTHPSTSIEELVRFTRGLGYD